MEFDVREVLVRPLITEKTDLLSKKARKYFFEVKLSATKGDIRRALETVFKVKVRDVRTMTVRGKKKRQGRFEGYVSDWKKAIVTLAEGQELNLEKI